MEKIFSIDALKPNSYLEIKNFLCDNLQDVIKNNRDIIFLCIGSDRSTGDCLGPLVGYKLKFLSRNKVHIYGCLESPVHAKNLQSTLDKIYSSYKNPYIIAIDTCLGKLSNIGKVFIEFKPLQPGSALNKDLPAVGDLSITGIVNISGTLEFMILQNTRLYSVMSLADCISKGVYHFILNYYGKDSKYFTSSLDSIKCL